MAAALQTDAKDQIEVSKATRVTSDKTDEEKLRDFAVTEVDYAGSSKKTDAKEIRLVRKLDMWILPMLWFLNFMNLMQRQSISVAPLGGLNDDLGLVGTQFSTVVSVHYVGYILGQIPGNLLMVRVRPSLVMASAVLACAVTTLCMAVVNDFGGLVAVRFILGIVAAPAWPGTLYVVSSFYKRKELGTRVSILYSANIISSAFQGLIAAPIFSELSNARGYHGWQWMYIIFGTASGLCAIIAFFICPNTPKTTWWLTSTERDLAHSRMVADTVEKQPDVKIIDGLKQVAKDKYVWIFCAMHHIHTATSTFRSFLPTLLNTLGYNTTITLVLTCPPYLLSAAVAIGLGLSSGKFNERTWHLTGLKVTAMLGFIIGCASMNTAARLVAAFMFVGWTYGVTSLTLSWLGMTCGQTKEKRATALATANTFASTSQIWAPYLWPDSAAPRYTLPLASSAAFCLIGIILIWTVRLLLARDNKRIRMTDENARLLYAY